MAIVLCVALAAGLAVWGVMDRPGPAPSVLRASITPDGETELDWSPIAVSPDGSTLVYRGTVDGGTPSLYQRRLDASAGEQITGTEYGGQPFFSPDGRWVGFVTEAGPRTRLRKISLGGGVITDVAVLPASMQGGSWSVDDELIHGQPSGGLVRVPADGGEVERLTELDAGEVAHHSPHRLRGHPLVLFVSVADVDTALVGGQPGQLALLDLRTDAIVRLGIQGWAPRYARTGHVIYATGGGILRAVPFDPDRLEVLGDPVELVGANVALGREHRHVHVL